jgi:hypothetical protein
VIRPKVLRGALVEFGISVPPLFVVFQFNPEQLTRSRSLDYSAAAGGQGAGGTGNSLREFHKRYEDLIELRDAQQVTIEEEHIELEILLDASAGLGEGDPIAQQYGIAPQLSTLELMLHPKEESLFDRVNDLRLGRPDGFSFTKQSNPPMILFVWGRKRVLPVNIDGLEITEMMHRPDLQPVRATATLSMTVIEGASGPYLYSKSMKETMSVFNLASATDVANVVVPG